MKCEVTYEELSALAAGDLAAERTGQLEQHLPTCAECRRRLDAIGALDARLRSLRRLEPSAAVTLRARRLFSRELRAAPEVMTLGEVAEFLRVSLDDLGEIVAELPAFELAGRVRVRRTKLIEWIEKRERAYARSNMESEVAGILAGVI